MSCSRLILRSLQSFIRDQCSIFAASISFYFIMVIVPFLLFVITLIGFFMGENTALKDFVINKILEIFPDITRNITDVIATIVTYRGIGIFGFLVYAFLSFQLLKSAEYALNTVFKISDKRAIHHSILVSVGIITFIIMLFILSFTAATFVDVPPFLRQYIPEFEMSILIGILLRFVLPLLIMWIIITMLYIILPLKRPRVTHALKSALFVSIMLELAKHIFTWYIGSVAKFGHIYGPLTAFIIFFLWVYYSSCIFLVGAEMIVTIKESEEFVYEPSYW